jgi:hypothetical protein
LYFCCWVICIFIYLYPYIFLLYCYSIPYTFFQLSQLFALSVPPAALRSLYPPLSHPVSTLLAVITPTYCYPAALSIFYVISCWLSFLLGLLTREDGTDTLSRNVGKQLPHDAV